MGDETQSSSDDAGLLLLLIEREAAVDSLLRAGSTADALRKALSDPPFSSKDTILKDRSSAVAHKAIVALGSRDEALQGFFASIDLDTADALMKYIVKGLARHENSALYLKFHALVVEKCGVASVVRAIVDRKTA